MEQKTLGNVNARFQAAPRTLDVDATGAATKPRLRWGDLTAVQKLKVFYALVILGLIGPPVIIFGGLALLAIWDAMTTG